MTLIDSKQVNLKSFNPKKDIILLVLFTFALIIGANFLKNQEKNKLLNFKLTSATVFKKTKVYLGGYTVFYNYKVKSKNFSCQNKIEIEDYNKVKIGDTVLIKYSTTDNSVAEIVNCFWNEKLREDMNNQLK